MKVTMQLKYIQEYIVEHQSDAATKENKASYNAGVQLEAHLAVHHITRPTPQYNETQ